MPFWMVSKALCNGEMITIKFITNGILNILKMIVRVALRLVQCVRKIFAVWVRIVLLFIKAAVSE